MQEISREQLIAQNDLLEGQVRELKEAGDRFRLFFYSAPVGLSITSVQGDVLNANKVMQDLLGYPLEELKTINVIDFYLDPTERQRLLDIVEKSDVVRDFETRFKRKDGKVITVLMDTDLIDFSDQHRVLLTSIRDISILKQTEAQLTEERELTNAIQDTAASLVMVLDREGMITRFNRACEKVTGYSFQEMKGQHIWDTLSANPALAREEVDKLLAGNYPSTHESSWKTRSGEQRLISWSNTVLLDNENKVEYIIATGIDITERKQEEEEARSNRRQLTDIIEFLPDATLAINMERRIIIWNKAIEKMSGVPAAEMIGKGDYAYTIPFYGKAQSHLMDLVFLDDEEIRNRYPLLNREGDSLTAEAFCPALYNNRGAWVYAKASALHDQSGKIIGAIESIRDINEQKLAEMGLKSKTAFLEAQTNVSLDGILVVDEKQTRILTNRRFLELFNVPQNVIDDADDTLMLEHFTSLTKEPEQFFKKVLYLYDHVKEVSRDEIELKNGMVMDRYSAPVTDKEGKYYGRIWTFHDITERKRAEAALIQQVASQAILLKISNQFASSVADNIDDLIRATLQELGIFNEADHCHLVLFSEDSAKVKTTHEWCAEGIPPSIYVLQDLPVELFPWTLKQLQRHETVYISSIDDLPPEAQPEKELMLLKGTQSMFFVPVHYEDSLVGFLRFDSISKKIVGSKESITMLNLVAQTFANALQRKKYIETIRESENYYRTIFKNTGAVTMIIEEDLTITNVNEECQRLLGYAREELIGKKWSDFIPSDKVETMQEYHHKRLANLAVVPLKYQTRIIDRQGTHKDGLVAVDMISGTNKSVVNFIDFTEFNRIDRALKAISAVTMAMVQAENEEDLLRNVCQKIVEVGEYSLVGVVYLQADPQQTLHPVASAGKDNGYFAKLNITLQDPQRGQGPAANAIRTGQPVVTRDVEKEATFKPWLKDALRQGFKSLMVIPLMADNKAFGALGIYSSEIGRFDSNEQILVNEMGNDLSYAIMSMRAHIEKIQTAQELKISLEKMQRILMQAVTSLGATLDTRDPYTAGHQRRVAHLAAAIAEEMGLSKDKIEGISVAGNLHDIGKISIPSEIFNKPGKLTDIEFAMIKTHSQAGYEIVKDIEFPWPVAEVILQTHERMNGSGYPRGLAGEDILMEARIMAVVDVVEAMASHRPYRPALGIEAALEEIVQNRGILYDPNVVDACLKLFHTKGFKLE